MNQKIKQSESHDKKNTGTEERMSMLKDKTNEKVSRKSAGFFRFLEFFKSTPFLILLFIGLTVGVGFISVIFNLKNNDGNPNWDLLLRDVVIFGTILLSGTFACYIFRDKTPFFAPRMALLMNAFGTGMFALSYLAGSFLDYLLDEGQHFGETFFMFGALISYIVLFVIFFSFTRVGQPWYIFLALVQPSIGILIYSFYSAQLTIVFLTKAVIFFMISAMVFAVIYGPLMAHVSIPYRKEFPGVGGYKFLRAFVEALLTDNNDENIERFFEEYSEERELRIQYIGFKDIKTNKLKGLFVVPNVHFGPFKTCGSAALPEKIYKKFDFIPGLTVFHTTTTHGSNFSSKQFNTQFVAQMKQDLQDMKFETTKISMFRRLFKKKTKVLGVLFNQTPFLMYTRHPFPTDDIAEGVGKKIQNIGINAGFLDPVVVDCHNSLIGDEVMITEDSDEATEMEILATKFFGSLNQEEPKQIHEKIYYGVARDFMEDIPIEWGIGNGGIIVHIFKLGNQETALIHADANNALTNIRPAIINLGENEGLDRVELSTSDTHAVVRILSAQGYHPLGSRVVEKEIIKRLKPLIKEARKNASAVQIGTMDSKAEGYRFWKNLGYFSLIIETIQRALSVSKFLLTVGLIFPGFITLILSLFWL